MKLSLKESNYLLALKKIYLGKILTIGTFGVMRHEKL